MEIWKDILGYEGHYQISNYGRVKSFKWNKERILLGGYDKDGYNNVNLSLYNKTKTYTIHRLVAQAFLGLDIKDSEIEIDHIDDNKINNKLENLQLVTGRENVSKINRTSSSKYVGVSFNKRLNKWRSDIWINGKNEFLGLFDIEEEAHQAYLKALDFYKIENKYSTYVKKTTK